MKTLLFVMCVVMCVFANMDKGAYQSGGIDLGAYQTNESVVVDTSDTSGTWYPVSDSPPTITVQPQSDSIALGSDAVLSVTATGTAPISYQWQVKSGTWQDSVSTNNDSLTVSAGIYRVIVSNAFGADTSDSAVITLFDPIIRRYSWVDSTFRTFSLSIPDSGNVGAKINNVNLPLTKWSGGQVIGTVPTGTPAGLYKSPGLWLYQYTGGDTTAIDTLGAVRVLKFQVRSVE